MNAIPRSIRSIALAAVAALALGAPLSAQDAAVAAAPAPSAPQAEATTSANVGPIATNAAVAVRRVNVEAPAPAVPAASSRATALMIVGGAAILTGIVIGNGAGYAISVGGAVIGLYGLYLYLQ